MPQIITPSVLNAMFEGYNVLFNKGFAGVSPQYASIAMVMPSSASAENYGWLGQVPRIREWIGDRDIKTLNAYGMRIVNRQFESTVAVPRPQIEDDTYGVFAPVFERMGRSVAQFPDEMCFPLLPGGWSGLCYDGQNFFDQHPVLDALGKIFFVQNFTGSAPSSVTQPGTWYLVDSTQGFKPLVWQTRRPFEFVAKTNLQNSDIVFERNEFVYGVDGRANAGYGLWQTISASTLPLTRTNFRTLYEQMVGMKADYGRPLGIVPNEIWVGPSMHATARDLFESDFLAVDGVPGEAALASGAGVISNTDKHLVKVRMTPWLP